MGIHKHLGYLRTDFRGECAFVHQSVTCAASSAFATVATKIACALKGVKLGKNVKARGRAHVHRCQDSTITIGHNCVLLSTSTSNLIGVNHRCIISTQAPGAIIDIGDGCGLSGTVIGAFTRITLGKNVRCGANTLITDSDWHTDDPRSGPPREVVIGDNVWLGVNSVVLKGVTIGKNSVIGANSVVTRDIPPNVIAAGNPCKVIKQIQN